MPDIAWIKPTVSKAPSFASIDGTIVGYVADTAFPDGRWLAQVLPMGPDREGYYCYARTEARARSFVENWLKYHAPHTTGWKKRKPMPHKGEVRPQKPKGAEDRS